MAVGSTAVHHHAVPGTAVCAGGTHGFHFPAGGYGAAAQALEVDIVTVRALRRIPAAQPLLEGALPDIAEDAGARAAIGAARLQRYDRLDPAHLAATQAFEMYLGAPFHARAFLPSISLISYPTPFESAGV